MLFLISPAKTLDFESSSFTDDATQPQFQDESSQLIDIMREFSSGDLSKMMKVSEKIAEVIPTEDLAKVYSQDELMTMGEKVYMTACAACHQASGEGMAPVFPGLKGSAIATGDVAVHLDMVLNGSKKNPAMAAFAGQLTKTQIAAVVTYERNAWGNNTGDLVQPADVAASAK